MEDATQPPDEMLAGERQVESGQALVEYSLIILLVVIAALTTMYTFQDAVINGLWGATSTLVDRMGG